MYELYSRRIKNAAGEPEVYEYDTFSDAFRNQAFYALSDVLDFFERHGVQMCGRRYMIHSRGNLA